MTHITPPTFSDVLSTPGYAMPAHSKSSSTKLFASSTFSLKVIGIGSIWFGCANLVAGFAAFSIMHSWKLPKLLLWQFVFTYVWAGCLFTVVSGSLVLKAATVKPHVDRHWTNVAFGFGIATLVLHVMDAVFVVTSVVTFALLGFHEIYSEGPFEEYTGSSKNYDYHTSHFLQPPLIAEAPRLVIVSVLLALDIWLLVVTSKLRQHYLRTLWSTSSSNTEKYVTDTLLPSFRQQIMFTVKFQNVYPIMKEYSKTKPPVITQFQLPTPAHEDKFETDVNEDLQLLGSGRTAMIACGYFSFVYGLAELTAGVCSYVTWRNMTESFYNWLSYIITITAFTIAVVNGAFVLRAAYNNFVASRKVVYVVVALSIVNYLVATGFCLCTLFMFGQSQTSTYKSSTTVTAYNLITNVYFTRVLPAVPEAARLVALFVLICVAVVELVFVSKLKRLFVSNCSTTNPFKPIARWLTNPMSASANACSDVRTLLCEFD